LNDSWNNDKTENEMSSAASQAVDKILSLSRSMENVSTNIDVS